MSWDGKQICCWRAAVGSHKNKMNFLFFLDEAEKEGGTCSLGSAIWQSREEKRGKNGNEKWRIKGGVSGNDPFLLRFVDQSWKESTQILRCHYAHSQFSDSCQAVECVWMKNVSFISTQIREEDQVVSITQKITLTDELKRGGGEEESYCYLILHKSQMALLASTD